MTEKKPVGRPSRYTADHDRQAFELALLGLTEPQMAAVFDVTTATITTWKQTHPTFLAALKAGKDDADAKVTQSLYKRATGYTHKAVKIFANPNTGAEQVIEFEERFPPDTTACIFWLKNRQNANWRDRRDVEHSGTLTLAQALKALEAEDE